MRPLAAADRLGRTLRRGHGGRHEHQGSHHHAGFLAFLRAVLVPELRRRHPNATVLMDNLPAHKPKAVATVLAEAGLKLLYLPRYSPDLSPIEPGWSKAKSALRAAEARTPEALEAALAPALDSITPADARGWFNHCGYSFPN
jgi:transposase